MGDASDVQMLYFRGRRHTINDFGNRFCRSLWSDTCSNGHMLFKVFRQDEKNLWKIWTDMKRAECILSIGAWLRQTPTDSSGGMSSSFVVVAVYESTQEQVLTKLNSPASALSRPKPGTEFLGFLQLFVQLQSDFDLFWWIIIEVWWNLFGRFLFFFEVWRMTRYRAVASGWRRAGTSSWMVLNKNCDRWNPVTKRLWCGSTWRTSDCSAQFGIQTRWQDLMSGSFFQKISLHVYASLEAESWCFNMFQNVNPHQCQEGSKALRSFVGFEMFRDFPPILHCPILSRINSRVTSRVNFSGQRHSQANGWILWDLVKVLSGYPDRTQGHVLGRQMAIGRLCNGCKECILHTNVVNVTIVYNSNIVVGWGWKRWRVRYKHSTIPYSEFGELDAGVAVLRSHCKEHCYFSHNHVSTKCSLGWRVLQDYVFISICQALLLSGSTQE